MAIIATNRPAPVGSSPLSDIYIDESSQTKNRFLVMGGIDIETMNVEAALACLAHARLPSTTGTCCDLAVLRKTAT
jgi:hypothetical protein